MQISVRGIIRVASGGAFSLKAKWLWINEAGSRLSSTAAAALWLCIGSLEDEMSRVSEIFKELG